MRTTLYSWLGISEVIRMSSNELTPERVNDSARAQLPQLGYPASLIAVLFDKLDRLTERWESLLLVFIGLLTIVAMGTVYFSRENPVASASIVTVFIVAVSAAVFARLKKL